MRFKRLQKNEVKWTLLKREEKIYFCNLATELQQQHPNLIHYHSITVNKKKVSSHIRKDSNKLYNYMIGLSLIDKMRQYECIDFILDYRSIKVKSGNSLSDYLQIQLWFEKEAKTLICHHVQHSNTQKGLQFADMLAGAIQQHYEDNYSESYHLLKKCMNIKELYFSKLEEKCSTPIEHVSSNVETI